MRIWDIHVKHLCRKHLLSEHRELHGLWNILTKHKGRGGYSKHPETLRWAVYANIPYLLWVSFATVLQLTITYLNR